MRLHINIDHVATLRNARGTVYPDPVQAAHVCLAAGAHGITAHLREDRRHIKDDDVRRLAAELRGKWLFNLEMAATDEMVGVALATNPDCVTLVPERREERTTEGGLEVARSSPELAKHVAILKSARIKVSLFIAPDLVQIRASQALGVEQIELHTGEYAHHSDSASELNRLGEAASGRARARARDRGRARAHDHERPRARRDSGDRRAQHRACGRGGRDLRYRLTRRADFANRRRVAIDEERSPHVADGPPKGGREMIVRGSMGNALSVSPADLPMGHYHRSPPPRSSQYAFGDRHDMRSHFSSICPPLLDCFEKSARRRRCSRRSRPPRPHARCYRRSPESPRPRTSPRRRMTRDRRAQHRACGRGGRDLRGHRRRDARISRSNQEGAGKSMKSEAPRVVTVRRKAAVR